MIKALTLLLAAIATMWGEPCSAQAVLYPTERPAIVFSLNDGQTFSDILAMNRGGASIRIGASISENPQQGYSDSFTFKEPIDVYIGMIGPDQSVRSWQPEGNGFLSRGILMPGILPYAKNFQAPANFSTQALHNEVIWYRFGLEEPAGLYSIFLWIVKAGAPIGDPRRWVGAATYPLFVQ